MIVSAGPTSAAAGPPRRVAIVLHSARADARDAATAAAKRLVAAGVEVVGSHDAGWPEGLVESRDAATFGNDVDVVVVFGGDGTLLRAAYLARDWGIPLLGINLGRLGFLSEVEAGDLDHALELLLKGSYEVEERMTLSVHVHDADGDRVGTSWALNEAAVERSTPERLMVFEVRVGETTFANVPSDAIICATPTGSTAYAFSARGPILSPLIEALLIVPVAPHALFDRTLVVDPAETLAVRPHDAGSVARVSLDGRESIIIPRAGFVRVTRGDAPVRMVRLSPFDFYARVRDKFGLR